MENQQNQNGKTSPGQSRRRMAAVYIGVFLLSWAIFAIITFPYDLLAQGIMHRVQSNLPVPVNAARIEPHLPLRVDLVDVEIGPFSKNDARKIPLDAMIIRASLMKAIRKRIDASVDAKLFGGKLIAQYVGNDVAGDAKLRLVSIDVKPLLGLLFKIPWDISGEIGGKGNFHWDRLKDEENKGRIRLHSNNLRASEVVTPLVKANFNFTKAEADLALDKGDILKVNSLKLEGKPCGFELTGTVKLNPRNFPQSRLDLEIKFDPTEEFEKKVPFGFQLKKDDEGLYIGRLTGTIKKPNLVPIVP